MSHGPHTLLSRISLNEGLRCKVKGCDNPRTRLSGYCKDHKWRRYYYGDPEGRRIKPKEYAEERNRVESIIEMNKKHAGIIQTIALIDQWLRHAASGRRIAGRFHFERLHEAGVTGRDILIETAALILFAHRNRGSYGIPDGKIPLAYALGLTVIRMVPCHRTVQGVESREIGELLWKHFSRLYMNIQDSVKTQEIKAKETLINQSAPLKI